MNQPPTDRHRKSRLLILLLGFATLVVYLPVVRFGFVNFDDQVYVTDNASVKAGLTLPGLHWAFTTFHGDNWHPLTWLSHMMDCELFGLNPGALHFTNVIIHSLNAAILLLLLFRLTGLFWPAMFVAALFAWHPLHVESVAWISERKDVLSTFFALLALLSYVNYVKLPSRTSFWLAWLCFSLSLLAKPMLVTLPFILLLLDFWPLQRFSTSTSQFNGAGYLRLLIEKIPFVLLSLASCAVTLFAQRQAEMTMAQLSFGLRLQYALIAYATYLLKMVWPVDLAILYPLPGHLHWIHLAAATSAIVLIVLSGLAWGLRKRSPSLLFGWLWFLGTLVPVIGLVKVGSVAYADRYTYLPLVGIFIAIAYGLHELTARFSNLKKPAALIACLVLVACVTLTERQLQFWHDSETLFRHDLAVVADNPEAHINLGAALENTGHPTEALAQYQQAVHLAEDNADAHINLANLLYKTGHTADAFPEFQRALALNPANANYHYSLGFAYVGLERFTAATNELAIAARLDPQTPWPHFEQAVSLLALGLDQEAVGELRSALRLQPDDPQILAYTAHVLAADENAAARDGRSALILALKANLITGSSQPMILDVLGMALAETGDFTNAQTSAKSALGLANASHLTNTQPIQQRLELYQKNLPWRESFRSTNAP